MAYAILISLALLGTNTTPANDGLMTKQAELGEFGACLVRQAPKQSEKLLHTAMGSPEEREAANTLALGHASCLHRQVLTGRSGAIRGAVAQAMFMRDPALLDRFAARPAAPPSRPDKAKGREFLINYGRCLSEADPKTTVALLRTGYATTEEHNAFVAYGDNLKACMPIGEQYHVDIADMRNQIAALAYLAVDSAGAQ